MQTVSPLFLGAIVGISIVSFIASMDQAWMRIREHTGLTFTQWLRLTTFGSVKVKMVKNPGWTVEMPLYAFICSKHGLQFDTPHGYHERLDCPECLKEAKI